ncbi:MAG: peptide-methionine (S)-S-oxide reductase MsrA [Ruminococcaceae bacterium]|jgi:methionine-S-sulfoxide reductase|nr:peptide-methionine (S)-S-oxide reductase MsrA [Oscillospiraceae bacterium]
MSFLGLAAAVAAIGVYLKNAGQMKNNGADRKPYHKVEKKNDAPGYRPAPKSVYEMDKGSYGEYLLYRWLRVFEGDARLLFNLYIPKYNGETTEIDALMVCRKGIIVFESKNYSGWIFGNENRKDWHQTLPSRDGAHKESFYNPIMQNDGHIYHLKQLIKEDIPFWSIIAFSDRCEFKSVPASNDRVRIIHRCMIRSEVQSILDSDAPDVLDSSGMRYFYELLYPCTQVTDEVRERHIDRIRGAAAGTQTAKYADDVLTMEDEWQGRWVEKHEMKSVQSSPVVKAQINTCPLCGGRLIMHRSTESSFYGCENYPTCKFVAKRFAIHEEIKHKGECTMKTLYLAGGCFWGTQRFFDQFRGVLETEVGYANGPTANPTYKQVCSDSGHAETVRVVFDETAITVTQLLEHYFRIIDPTAVNHQGEDEGIQYRTGVYYDDPSLLPGIEAVFDRVRASLDKPLAVELRPLENFYSAEEYHQKYLVKNPGGYCHIPAALFELEK